MGHDAFQAADLLGAVVDDRFEILAKLGEGGMGAIYKARQISMDREVALKILLHDQRGDPISVERFRHEAYLASRLNHPNAIVIHDFGQSADGLLYIAMEFLDGETVKERLQRVGRLPLKSALSVASQTLRVLAEAHRMGLVHRDIKPDNIFLTQLEGDPDFVKVLDFGIAKLTAVREGLEGYQGGLTVKGKIYGTPNYMSPEQIRGKPLDHQSDLYSFGIVLYELLAGHLPFEAETPVDVMMMHLRDPPPALSSQRPEIRPELENVVLRALEKDRRLRFQNADEFLEAIESFKYSSGFYAVPARLMIRSTEEAAADDDVTGALGATLMPGSSLDLAPTAADEEDDDDATLMGARVAAPPVDERTMMEFGDEADEKTAFEEEGEASGDLAGESVFELLEDSLLSPPTGAPDPLTTGLVSIVRPGPGLQKAPTPVAAAPVVAQAQPVPLGPPAPVQRARPVEPVLPRTAAMPVAKPALVPAAKPVAQAAPVPSVFGSPPVAQRDPSLNDMSMLDADDLEEVEPSRLVPIPHFDDSLGGQDKPVPRPEARSASPFGNPPTQAKAMVAATPEAARAPAVVQRAGARPATADRFPAQANPVAPPAANPQSVRVAPVVSAPVVRTGAQPAMGGGVPLRTGAQAPLMASGAQGAARVQDIATVGTNPRAQVRRSRKGLFIGLGAALAVCAAAVVVLLVIKPFDHPKVVAKVGPATLSFASNPEGLEVFRNGRFVGETPVAEEIQERGDVHDLQVAAGNRTYQIKVPALPESSWLYFLMPTGAAAKAGLGHAIATSQPSGAVVRLAEKEIGHTPLILIGPLDQQMELQVEQGGTRKMISARTTAAGERVEAVLQ